MLSRTKVTSIPILRLKGARVGSCICIQH